MNSKERMQNFILQKYSLAAIENELHKLQALPQLQEEKKLRISRLLEALGENRSAITEQQRLYDEAGNFTAKLVQTKREINDFNKSSNERTEKYSKVEQLIEQEKMAKDQVMSEYEAKSTEITNKCRQNANIYNEEMTRGETRKANQLLSFKLAVVNMYQDEIAELKEALDNMNQDVPDNMSVIVGRTELEEKLNSLTNTHT